MSLVALIERRLWYRVDIWSLTSGNSLAGTMAGLSGGALSTERWFMKRSMERNWYFRICPFGHWRLTSWLFFLARSHVRYNQMNGANGRHNRRALSNDPRIASLWIEWQTMTRAFGERRPSCNYPKCLDRFLCFLSSLKFDQHYSDYYWSSDRKEYARTEEMDKCAPGARTYWAVVMIDSI